MHALAKNFSLNFLRNCCNSGLHSDRQVSIYKSETVTLQRQILQMESTLSGNSHRGQGCLNSSSLRQGCLEQLLPRPKYLAMINYDKRKVDFSLFRKKVPGQRTCYLHRETLKQDQRVDATNQVPVKYVMGNSNAIKLS